VMYDRCKDGVTSCVIVLTNSSLETRIVQSCVVVV